MLLAHSWFERGAEVVAPELLNKVIVHGECAGRIIEVEAYEPDDPASHSFRGMTPRNAVMFGPAGHLYCYLSYGVHTCANVVTGAVGSGAAVLIRAVDPLAGIEQMRLRRGGQSRLADGPGKVCQAMAITLLHNGVDLCAGAELALVDDGTPPPSDPVVGPRVGITKAVEVPWRFRVPPTTRPATLA